MPRLPDKLRTIHLMGICGTGMGAFAGLLKQAGYDVRGSDQGAYPPMSDKLRDWGIEVRTPYAPENLDPVCDLVVVGNVIPAKNPEATAMRDRGLVHASFPETFSELFLKDRHPVVVAGTHGKTTTTTLLAHVLMAAGQDPGFLIGGIPIGFDESFRVGGQGPDVPVVVEGDEYDTAYFDKGPKFLHYRPKSLMVTSLEFDHADIYDSVDEIRARFVEVLRLVPADGHIVAFADAPEVLRALEEARPQARVETYGRQGDIGATDIVDDAAGLHFTVTSSGTAGPRFDLPLNGPHNLHNALGAYAIARGLGLSDEAIGAGFKSFPGVRRRMDIVGEQDQVTVVDDFAHHPTAVDTTLRGAKARFAPRPVWALFEPRSATSCRKVFQDDYAKAFAGADRVLLAPPGRALDPAVALDVEKLAADISAQGIEATACTSIDEMVRWVIEQAPPGAVMLCMSNGAFGGIHQRLLDGLRGRAKEAPPS